MKHDVILVHPPQRGLLNGFATGLADLANFVAARAPEVRVSLIDLALSTRAEVIEEARQALLGVREPPLIGITTTTASYRSSLETARAFKALAPESIVVLGGHHASPQHEVVLRRHSDIVDVVVRGEGERALLNLAKGVDPTETPNCSSIRRGEVRANPAGSLLSTEELDTLPVSYEGLSFQSAPGKFDHATYVSARGCPLHCAFCAVAGEAVRAKSVARVVQDLQSLVLGHGYKRIAIEDNFFAQNRTRIIGLCEEIARLQSTLKEPFSWDCQTRVESMRSQGLLDALSKAGCEAVYLGVESLIESELEFLAKTSNPGRYVEIVSEVCAEVLKQPFDCYINLQVGLPNEEAKHRELRLERLARLGQLAAARGRQITVFPQIHVIYPGTQHFWRAVQERMFGRLGSEVFEAFTEWEAEEEPILRFLGQNFAHGVGGIPTGILNPDLLRESQFHVLDESILTLREHLDRLDRIEGVHLFKYGAHILPPHAHDIQSETPMESAQ